MVDLKTEMKKLIFSGPSGEPLIVSENSGLFQIVMSSCLWYEKEVGVSVIILSIKLILNAVNFQAKMDLSHAAVGEILKKFMKHFGTSFQKDFPFYILVGYRMRM